MLTSYRVMVHELQVPSLVDIVCIQNKVSFLTGGQDGGFQGLSGTLSIHQHVLHFVDSSMSDSLCLNIVHTITQSDLLMRNSDTTRRRKYRSVK